MNRAEVRRRQAGMISNGLMLAAMLILGQQTGNNGITYLMTAALAYALLWTIVGGNLSDTLGRLLRSRKNKGQYKNAWKMRRSAMILQSALGLAGSAGLFVFSKSIAEGLFGLRCSTFIVAVLSPVVFLRAVSSVLMGCFQGEGSELPTAAAGILRPIFFFGFGILFSGIMGDYGEKVGRLLQQENFEAMYKGAGIAIAVSLAELLVVLFLALIYRAGEMRKNGRQEGYGTESGFECVRHLCAGRWQQAVTGFLGVLPLGLGLFFLSRRTEEEAALTLGYGAYAGGYLVLCAAVASLIAVSALPVMAKIFSSLRKSEHRFARTVFQGGMHICLVHSAFAAVFVAVMGQQIGELLCPESVEAVLPMLRAGSCVIAFAVLAYYFARFLQTAGKKQLVMLAVGAGDALFFVVVLATGKAGALSLVYGGITGTFLLCIMLGVFACGQLRVRIDWMRAVAVPAGAALVSGLLCMLIGKLIAPHMHASVTLLVAFVIGGAAYWAALTVLRNFDDQELDVIPGGKLIDGLRQMLHIY